MDIDDVFVHGSLVAMSSLFGYAAARRAIPVVAKYLLTKTHLYGLDMGKIDKPKVPESLGTAVGVIYLTSFLLFFILMPALFINLGMIQNFSLADKFCTSTQDSGTNGLNNGLSYIAAITSITAMLILGFIDDCYDLRWRYKLMFPSAATIPLLGVYYYNYGERTVVLVPQFIVRFLKLGDRIDLGVFYYIFMLMFVIFCTNAINIYAGINGLEVGQAIVLTVTVILYNLIEVTTKSDCDEVHILSLQILLPFLFSSCALYQFNRYPAQVFVGDSFCYFAGMTLGVVGILGHFSEEILLFATPQVFNFIVSVPQLFKIVPCPRHRLPKFNAETGLREPSTFTFRYSELNFIGRIIMKTFATLGLAILKKEDTDDGPIDQYTSNNLTLINLWLSWFGPRSERDLCHQLLRFQSWLSFLALASLTIKMHHE